MALGMAPHSEDKTATRISLWRWHLKKPDCMIRHAALSALL
jgi:hypothetical protein